MLSAYVLAFLAYSLWEKSWAIGPSRGMGEGSSFSIEMCRIAACCFLYIQ